MQEGGGGEVRALWVTETTLLDSLMYRNKNQHGRAGYWKRLQEVKRRTKELDVPALLELLASVRQDLLVGTRGAQAQKGQAKAKAQALAAKRCAAVGMAIQECCAALESCTGAAELLVQEVAQGYFLNLLVLFLAMLGRLSALLRHVGTLAFGLYQALEGRVGEVEEGQEEGKTRGVQRRFSMRKMAHALGWDVGSEEVESAVEGAAAKRQKGSRKDDDDDDDDDDLGVSLGAAAAAAASFTFPIPAAPVLSVRTKVIPTSTTVAVAKAGATSSGKASSSSRAMLASEYSSSSEEEEAEDEDEEDAGAKKQQQQQQQQQPQPPSPSLPTTLEDSKKNEEDEAIRFVIDRKPDTLPPGSSKQGKTEQLPSQKNMSQAFLVAPTGAAKKKNEKSKQKGKQEASGGSLLDAIDDIFNAAGAKKGKKRKIMK